MKKVLTVLVTSIFIGSGLFAQDAANELKNFRFGLKVSPVIDWLRADNKSIENGGTKIKFGYGLITEFRLSSIISFSTGIEGAYDGGKLNFKDSAIYYSSNNEFIAPGDTASHKGKYSIFKLNSRDYSMNYVVIPLALKMKTKDISGMTYFGMFGVDLGIRTKGKATDEVTSLNGVVGSKSTQTDVIITSDVNLFRMNLNVGAGFEYNLSGSTSLLVNVNYKRGFISAPKAESENLYLQKDKKTENKFTQPALLDGIALTVGILF